MRRCIARLTAVEATCVPPGFVNAMDLAFYFPRFQWQSHVSANGIPEVKDALETLQTAAAAVDNGVAAELRLKRSQSRDRSTAPLDSGTETDAHGNPTYAAMYSALYRDAESILTLKKAEDKALVLLSRAEEIYDNIGAVGHSNAAIADAARPVYAAKLQLLDGLLPRITAAHNVHVHKLILKTASKLLYHNESWTKSDAQQVDTACVVMAHFIKSFVALHPRPQNAQQAAQRRKRGGMVRPCEWTLQVGASEQEVLTLPRVMEQLNELIRLCTKLWEVHGSSHPSLRWNVPKLTLLKALLTIPLTGNLVEAQALVDSAANMVYTTQRRKLLIMEGLASHRHEAELGLFILAQAEMAVRVFDWDVEPGEVDEGLLLKFENAAKFYSEPLNHPLDADSIMDEQLLSAREFEVDAYCTCLLSYASFLLSAPRPPGKTRKDSPVFLPKQLFTTSPLITVDSSSEMIYSDVSTRVKLTVDVARKHTGEALERALKLNRALYPDHRNNAKAGWILLSMAALYADTRDYLYATGLFASAEKALTAAYGSTSPEHLAELRLKYEFLAGVGSEQEAKTAGNEIVHLLKRLDGLPH